MTQHDCAEDHSDLVSVLRDLCVHGVEPDTFQETAKTWG